MLKLWVDDIRPAPEGWIWAKDYSEAMIYIRTGNVSQISLDHDLGESSEKTGYDIACQIEALSHSGQIPPMAWSVHSANPIGKKRIISALTSAEKFW